MADRWTLVISGEGPHHSGHGGDVDALALEFLTMLRVGGHRAAGSLTAHGQSFALEAPIAERPAQLSELAVLVDKSES